MKAWGIPSGPRAGLLGALVLALPWAAQADVRGSARLSDFGWSIVDLVPDDGITAAVSFNGRSFETGLGAEVSMRGLDGQGQPLPYGTLLSRRWSGAGEPFPTVGRWASLPGTQAGSQMGGQADGGSFHVSLQGRGQRGTGAGLDYSRFENFGGMEGTVVLAPNTALVWTGQLSLMAEKTGSGAGMRHERVRAGFSIHMESDDPIVEENQQVRLDTFGLAPGRLTHTESLRFEFRNYSDIVVPASFGMNLYTGGYSSANPVPEPGTVGLMLAGVGVVGFVARRRKSPCSQGSAG